MKFYRFNKETSNRITNYNSVLSSYSKIIQTEEPTNVGFIHIEPNGIVGYHEAPIPQLFIVIQGEGWIRGKDNKKRIIQTGEAVFWQKGEGHESGSRFGMTALVIQSKTLTPFQA
ncbi:MAG: cupin domain-containing protein [Bacillaceae bacterium]